jgi:hypothetical protein
LQARKKVCEYLTEEGFDLELRFAGHCDRFEVGGRWSGLSNLLRLRHGQPRRFDEFWKRYRATETVEEADRLFRQAFPEYRGKLPINRKNIGLYGEPDDAQIMDEPLFHQLKTGFSEEVNYSYEIGEPNVICTEHHGDFEWPETSAEGAKFWVVVIDYHF